MKTLLVISLSLLLAPALQAELKLSAIISDHMVLQQNLANPIWGWDTPGTQVTVAFAGQQKTAQAGSDGKWTVKLDPVPANAQPQVLTISGTDKGILAAGEDINFGATGSLNTAGTFENVATPGSPQYANGANIAAIDAIFAGITDIVLDPTQLATVLTRLQKLRVGGDGNLTDS